MLIPHETRYGVCGYANHIQAGETRAMLKKLRRLEVQPPSRVEVLCVVNVIIKDANSVRNVKFWR